MFHLFILILSFIGSILMFLINLFLCILAVMFFSVIVGLIMDFTILMVKSLKNYFKLLLKKCRGK